MEKKQLGQFFTVNSDYILSGFEASVKGKKITDPFAGSGDLLVWAGKNGAVGTRGYDIDAKYVDEYKIFFDDSIQKPKSYDFVLTNPPYLNVNKADQITKERYFKDSFYEDLYQISLDSIIDSREGIVIVPVNFLSAENSRRIKDLFFSMHTITRMNYFKQQVFPDTTYNVIAFHFKKSSTILEEQNIKFVIYPEEKEIVLTLKKSEGWSVGSEVLRRARTPNGAGIYRLTEGHIASNPGIREVVGVLNHTKGEREKFMVSDRIYDLISKNIILLRAIDSGSYDGRIGLDDIRKYGIDCLVSKPSSRHMIHLIFPEPVSIEKQEEIIDLFNDELDFWREKYDSLFLTNFRDNDRKRIGFDFIYGYLNDILARIKQDQNILLSV